MENARQQRKKPASGCTRMLMSLAVLSCAAIYLFLAFKQRSSDTGEVKSVSHLDRFSSPHGAKIRLAADAGTKKLVDGSENEPVNGRTKIKRSISIPGTNPMQDRVEESLLVIPQTLGLAVGISDGASTEDGVVEQDNEESSLYYNKVLFETDYEEMERSFKIYIYPEAYDNARDISDIFVPHKNPFDRTLGNYFSEHMFKINLMASKFVTKSPSRAHLFFLPFSVNVLRNDKRFRSEEGIIQFVADYVKNVSQNHGFWNRTQGADHFFETCHSVGKDVPSAVPELKSNAIQLVCSSNYFHKHYVPHKDIALPQIWPRNPAVNITPPHERTRLAFYSGRVQNSAVRSRLLEAWQNDTDMDLFSWSSNVSYEEGFKRSKFCLHVKGYAVNTARISDAIHFGCVPVIISDYYDLPFANILDWRQFSVIVNNQDILWLKSMLEGISTENYARLSRNVLLVRKHFRWHNIPEQYDSFHMSMYQLWQKRLVMHASSF